MSFDPEVLRNWPLPPVRQNYTVRDSILYAIGVGASVDPIGDAELAYLYEGHGPATIPTMATVIGQRQMWMDEPALGIDWRRIVHGEQVLTIHEPLPPQGSIISEDRVAGIFDKGAGRGAIVWTERTIVDARDGRCYATLMASYFLRGDGGFGGEDAPHPLAGKPVPEVAPDTWVDLATRPDQAILYRLSGDTNPLHIDRDFAVKAGFPAPILHGLCCFGMAARAVIASVCGGDPKRLGSIAARFSAPIFPGETVRTEIWQAGDEISFRCRTIGRDVTVLNNGVVRLRA